MQFIYKYIMLFHMSIYLFPFFVLTFCILDRLLMFLPSCPNLRS
ncbi:unnamed protein product [Arabidopsis halleri]